jgi:hypothetical protein
MTHPGPSILQRVHWCRREAARAGRASLRPGRQHLGLTRPTSSRLPLSLAGVVVSDCSRVDAACRCVTDRSRMDGAACVRRHTIDTLARAGTVDAGTRGVHGFVDEQHYQPASVVVVQGASEQCLRRAKQQCAPAKPESRADGSLAYQPLPDPHHESRLRRDARRSRRGRPAGALVDISIRPTTCERGARASRRPP